MMFYVPGGLTAEELYARYLAAIEAAKRIEEMNKQLFYDY